MKVNKATTVEPKVETKARRGRPKGMVNVEVPKAYINVTDKYRIDISDGKNFTVQEYLERTRCEDTDKWKAGDKYFEWADTYGAYHSEEIFAFKHIAKLMHIDKVKELGNVTIEEYLTYRKQIDDMLINKFESKIDKKFHEKEIQLKGSKK